MEVNGIVVGRHGGPCLMIAVPVGAGDTARRQLVEQAVAIVTADVGELPP